MGVTHYYKTNNPRVLAAWSQYCADKEEMFTQAKALAAKHNAQVMYRFDARGTSFAGLRLNDYRRRSDKGAWTIPDRTTGVSRPRKRGKDVDKALIASYAADSAKIHDAKLADVLTALGTNWEDLLFGGGYGFFSTGGALYCHTPCNLADATEIMATEYADAKARAKQEQEQRHETTPAA